MNVSLAERHRRLVRHGPQGWGEKALFTALAAAGWLFGGVGLIRRSLYGLGVLSIYRAAVPVISVGNLAVGGTGKTPVVDHVVKYLLAQGRRVAIVSRGYGGRVRGVGVVSAGDGSAPLLSPEKCGDEPYLLALRNRSAIVLVARRRPAAMRLAVERFGADVIVLDDGYQHLAAARDLDIVLLDARSPLGNGHPLPAGVLREFPSALQRGGVFLLTRCGSERPRFDASFLPGPLLHSDHRLAAVAFTLEGEEVALSTLTGKRGIAFAGIADPGAFFADLEQTGLQLAKRLFFSDHTTYDEAARRRLQEAAAAGDYLITTEKDAVKLQGYTFAVPCYRVPLRIEIRESELFERILQQLLVNGDTHGHFTRSA